MDGQARTNVPEVQVFSNSIVDFGCASAVIKLPKGDKEGLKEVSFPDIPEPSNSSPDPKTENFKPPSTSPISIPTSSTENEQNSSPGLSPFSVKHNRMLHFIKSLGPGNTQKPDKPKRLRASSTSYGLPRTSKRENTGLSPNIPVVMRRKSLTQLSLDPENREGGVLSGTAALKPGRINRSISLDPDRLSLNSGGPENVVIGSPGSMRRQNSFTDLMKDLQLNGMEAQSFNDLFQSVWVWYDTESDPNAQTPLKMAAKRTYTTCAVLENAGSYQLNMWTDRDSLDATVLIIARDGTVIIEEMSLEVKAWVNGKYERDFEVKAEQKPVTVSLTARSEGQMNLVLYCHIDHVRKGSLTSITHLPIHSEDHVRKVLSSWLPDPASFAAGSTGWLLYDFSMNVAELERESDEKKRAYDLGWIRPFLLVASMHPRRVLLLASVLELGLHLKDWFGDGHKEAAYLVYDHKRSMMGSYHPVAITSEHASPTSTGMLNSIWNGLSLTKKYPSWYTVLHGVLTEWLALISKHIDCADLVTENENAVLSEEEALKASQDPNDPRCKGLEEILLRVARRLIASVETPEVLAFRKDILDTRPAQEFKSMLHKNIKDEDLIDAHTANVMGDRHEAPDLVQALTHLLHTVDPVLAGKPQPGGGEESSDRGLLFQYMTTLKRMQELLPHHNGSLFGACYVVCVARMFLAYGNISIDKYYGEEAKTE